MRRWGCSIISPHGQSEWRPIRPARTQAPDTTGVGDSGAQMVARLRICGRTWLPKQLAQPLAGSVETWHFQRWTDWPVEPGGPPGVGLGFRVRFPAEVRHIAAAGGDNSFVTEAAAVRPLSPTAAPLAMPPAVLRPADATFTGNGKVCAAGRFKLTRPDATSGGQGAACLCE